VGLAVAAMAVALAASPVAFLESRQGADGGFAEAGGQAGPALTSWAVLGLRAAGADDPSALAYLRSQETHLTSSTDVALVALAEKALGARPDALLAALRAAERPNGEIGPSLNSTYWAVLALGAAPRGTARFILAHQTKDGGFSWAAGVQADSNDTAAALEALHVAGVTGPPVARAARFLLSFQNPDGGFELSRGRPVDRLGDPGAPGRGPVAAACCVSLPRLAAPSRRQLPVLGALRHDAGVGHRAGAGSARPQDVPALLISRQRSRPYSTRRPAGT
jgi:hypothetical protein